MTHILIPREPSTALLRPFIECPTPELDQAWAAMVRIAEVQHARDGRSCLAQIEEPASREHDLARMEAERNASLDRYRFVAEVNNTEAKAFEAGFSSGWSRCGAGAAPAAVAGPACPGFGLDAEQLERLRTAGLKPEEISGAADVQHARVRELLHWFARFAMGHANSKWLVAHSMELAYYLATEGTDRGLDIAAIKQAAYLEGVNISPRDRGVLEHLGTILAAPALEAPAAPAIGPKLARIMGYREHYRTWGRQLSDATELVESHPSHWRIVAEAMDELADALAAAPQAPAAPSAVEGVAQFRKKPVVISAIQWTGANLREVITFTDGPPDTRSTHAGMAWEAYEDLVARDGLMIYTLEGKHLASVGDWIIRGVKGEHYPCKPDIFAATYEPSGGAQAQGFEDWAKAQGGLPSTSFGVLREHNMLPVIREAWNAGRQSMLDSPLRAAPAAPAVDAQGERDAAFEAVRQHLCKVPRWSFHLDSRGNIRRVDDASGNWIEFSAAHALFDPVAVDSAIAAQAKEGGESA